MTPPTQTDLDVFHGSCAAVRERSYSLRTRAEELMRAARATCDEARQAQERLRQTVNAIRSARGTPLIPSGQPCAVGTPDPLPAILAQAGYTEDDIGDIADALMAAYQRAEATDDAEMIAACGDALRMVGRHLAVKSGPRAAGVVLN